ncbi:MAG: histidine kinase [bacterium]
MSDEGREPRRDGVARRWGGGLFREALEGSKVVLSTTDLQRRYTWIYNPHTAPDPSSILGRRDEDLVPLEWVAELIRLKERVLETGVRVREMVEIVVEGEPRFYDMDIHPKGDAESGEVTGLVAVGVDVTDHVRERESEREQLKEERDRLRHTIRGQHVSISRRDRQLRWLSSQLIRVEQRERQRLARFLHDDLQQLLVAASLQAEAVGESMPGGRREQLEGMRELEGLLDDAQHVARNLVTRLSPPILDGPPLSDVFTWLAERMDELHGLRVGLVLETGLESENDTLRRLLFDVARELLLNVVKHAGVRECSLRVGRVEEGWIRLEVEDEGAGIDPDRAPDREDPHTFGLFSLRRRVESAGGSTLIRSGPERGVLVRVEIPPGAFEDPAPGPLILP